MDAESYNAGLNTAISFLLAVANDMSQFAGSEDDVILFRKIAELLKESELD